MRKNVKQKTCRNSRLFKGIVLASVFAIGGLLFNGPDADAAVKAKSVSVTASNSSLEKPTTLFIGGPANVGTTKLKVKVKPAKASKKVTFSSSNKKVAIVSAAGKVTAKKTGTALVTVKANGNKKAKAKIKITVKKYVYPKKLSVKASKATLRQGESCKLSVSIKPANTSLKKVTYKSSNKSLATVSSKGVVKANTKKKAGTVKITVKAVSKTKAKKTLSAKINIKISSEEIKAEKIRFEEKNAYIGLTGESDTKTIKLPPIIASPAGAKVNVKYSCDNTDMATVDSKGNVTAKRMGEVTITADAGNGMTATCDIFISTSTYGLHDPSVYRDPVSGKYYTFGSHLLAAKSTNLIGWSWAADSNSGYGKDNKLFTKIYTEEFKEPYAFTMPNGAKENAWAPDIIYNTAMKKYCMYISIVDGSKKCCIAMASSDKPDGPYSYKGMLVCSSITKDDIDKTNVAQALGITKEEAKNSKYASIGNNSPDCIDATVLYDHDGNLWMVYGSFTTAGGIRLLKLDKNTGLRGENYVDSGDGTANTLSTDDPYYGKKIANTNGEGPYIQEIKNDKSPTGYYYYMWTSVGGLTPWGGYNMRMVRAENIEGPYTDPKGNLATSGVGRAELGLRVMDNYKFSAMKLAYTSCGGNSATDDGNGKTFIHFHQKFSHAQENFVTRTHQTFVNEDGWLVTAPYEYNGETIADSYQKSDVVGRYEFIHHRTSYTNTASLGKELENFDFVESVGIDLKEDGTVTGAYTGTWSLNGHYITITVDGKEYKGVVLEQYEQTDARKKVMTFTAIGSDNRTVWGSKTYKTDKEAVEYDISKISVPETVSDNFNLPKEGLFGSTVTWTSNNAAVSVENGIAKVTPDLEDTSVTLTATVKRGDVQKTKEFKLNVSAIKLVISSVVKGNHIDLPAKIGNYNIVWTSSDTSTIAVDGTVVLPASGQKKVVLTATIGTVVKKFDVIVLPNTVQKYIYQQDYSNTTVAGSGWSSKNASEQLTLEEDKAYGKYLQFAPGNQNSRGAVADFGVQGSLGDVYCVEFDLSLKAGDDQTTEFALTGTDIAYSNGVVNDGIDKGYIFKMSALKNTMWSVNGAEAVDIPADWVHVLAVVDSKNKIASIIISDDKKTYFDSAVTISGNGVLQGMYIRGGRYNSVTKVDNIKIY